MENGQTNKIDDLVTLGTMYEDYFLDYASYVILERAVPAGLDGLKPVQRRILHSMREMHDGRFHKVANIIGQTMQFHPHGDAAIGDALVNVGQKDLMIDCQGNWGDNRTGDRAAAARYIEARLTKFALEIAFNKQTTGWQRSYDGRKNEPIALPMKFPLLLAQGSEGIAVGLSTKILPHNFVELIKSSIKILQEKPYQIFPDFQTGGFIDVKDYNDGKRGGKVKVRAKIEPVDKKTIAIRELPYGVTTTNLIDSIIKANDKGKIKIKKVVDNTAKDVEISVELAPGISPEVTMDALYAFTNCEVSISPNTCVIIDDKPHFLTVSDLLNQNTAHTKELLRMELEIKKAELEEKWHFASLEKIFIEKRIYRKIEECENWEEVIQAVDTGLKQYIATPADNVSTSDKRLRLLRDITEDDITKLTEIKIRRISKYNVFKADEKIAELEKELEAVKHDLAHLTDFAIAYFENLLKKYGKGRGRKTQITTFDTIHATHVVATNAKLYFNAKDGFVGTGLKKDEFICDCSDIDDIIVFRKDGKFLVTKVADKTFVGKNILHANVWKKGDDRTTYNMVYLDGDTGRSMIKRFNVSAITRDREYDLTTGAKNSKVLYFTVNPNGESEVISVQLTQMSKAKVKVFDFDFETIAIKGRVSKGNILTRYALRKITQKSVGQSTLGAIKIWMDEVSGKLNTGKRGRYLGEFDTGDTILALYNNGSYQMTDFELTNRYDVADLLSITKYQKGTVISAIYYDGNRKWTLVKRFEIETTTLGQRYPYITEHRSSQLLFASIKKDPRVEYIMKINSKRMRGELNLPEFIDVKGWKALGNKISEQKLSGIKEIIDEKEEAEKLTAEDTVDLEVKKGQQGLF